MAPVMIANTLWSQASMLASCVAVVVFLPYIPTLIAIV